MLHFSRMRPRQWLAVATLVPHLNLDEPRQLGWSGSFIGRRIMLRVLSPICVGVRLCGAFLLPMAITERSTVNVAAEPEPWLWGFDGPMCLAHACDWFVLMPMSANFKGSRCLFDFRFPPRSIRLANGVGRRMPIRPLRSAT